MPETPPRLLQICAVDFTAYHFLLPLMRAQRLWGFRVELACARGAFAEAIEAEGFPVHDVPFGRGFAPWPHARAYRRLAGLIRRGSYQVAHVHTPVAAVLGRPAARRAGAALVLYTAHGFYFHDRMRPLLRRAHVALERWAQRYADFLFTQSAEDQATAVAEGIAPAERTLAIGNGVDLARFRPDRLDGAERDQVRRELNLGPGPVVTMMGRLVAEKGYFELIEAWATVNQRRPAARALLIGGALASDRENAEPGLRRRVAELGLGESVIFAGLRPDVPQLLGASDLFVLPSWREGMPRSIIEAMACGLPVIASDIRGCREEVRHDETGLLIPPKDPASLARAMLTLLEDEGRRKAMGRAARARAEAEFDERRVIERQRQVYERFLRAKGFGWPDPPRL